MAPGPHQRTAEDHESSSAQRGPGERLARRTEALPATLQPLARRVAAGLRAVAEGKPLTDDHAPVELLTDGILLRTLARGEGLR